MPPRSERKALVERYDRRQAEVISAAAAVFAENGFARTSVPALASALGMSAGSLYHYFPSKEDLLVAICDELVRPLLAEIESIVSSPGPAAERLRSAVGLWVEHVISHRDHMLVFQQERHVIDHGDRWQGVRDDRKRFERLLERLLDEARRAGTTRLDDTRLLLAALLGMVNHTAQWYSPTGRLAAAQVANGYVDLLVITGS